MTLRSNTGLPCLVFIHAALAMFEIAPVELHEPCPGSQVFSGPP